MRANATRTWPPQGFCLPLFLLLFQLLSFPCVVSPLSQASTPSFYPRTAIIAGATGYIGKAVVQESIRQGYKTVALVRSLEQVHRNDGLIRYFQGAQLVECDVTDGAAMNATLQSLAQESTIEAIVSCLASRSGTKKDAYAIDYQATLHCLQAGMQKNVNAKHFVLLSAFCLRNPTLQFQQAKLKFEASLQAQNKMTYSIVRPTAYFKSVSSQIQVVAYDQAPYVMFGDGEVTKCNPIADADLAMFMIDCITDATKYNKILNIGGPDKPITMRMQGEMIFNAAGITEQERQYVTMPLWIFDVIIQTLQFLANITQSQQMEDAAEIARIGKYYASEDMLTTDPNEKYGTVTLQEHYQWLIAQGRPEEDPYTNDALITRKQVANLMKVFS